MRETSSCGWPAASSWRKNSGKPASALTLQEAAQIVQAHPTHLVRAFTKAYGMPPHLYLTGRRVDLARRLLLAGHRSADVAVAAGFYDQAHLIRTFRRTLGITPARYASTR